MPQINWSQFNQNNNEQFRLVYERFHKVMYSCAGKVIRDGIVVDEIVVKAFHALWKLPVKTFEKEEQMLSFLYVTTRNLCTDHLRRKGDYTIYYYEELPVEGEDDPFGLAMQRTDVMRVLEPIIRRMPKQRRQVLLLYYIHEMKVKEIAREMKLEPSTVYAHLQAAIKELRRKASPEAKALWRNLLSILYLLLMILKIFFKNN